MPPIIKFHEFDVNDPSPSGFRHVTSATAFVKQLGTGANQFIDFGSGNISNGKQHSKTAAVVAFATSMNDATEAIFDMRFWISDFSDFITGSYNFNGFPSGKWIQGIKLTDASGYFIPTNLPSGQNWWNSPNNIEFDRTLPIFQELTASGLDGSGISNPNITQYMYLSLTVNTDVPPGVYGGNDGGWTYRMSYNYR